MILMNAGASLSTKPVVVKTKSVGVPRGTVAVVVKMERTVAAAMILIVANKAE
jgi:uncharacterized membrane protein YadS